MATINGLDKLLKKLDALGGNSKKALKTGILQASKKVQGDAKELCISDNGQLRNSIDASVEEKGGDVVGKVSTNVEYAPYVEFGTGPVGRASPKDIPPGVDIQYRVDGWWIHESQIDAKIADKYHFFRIETPQGVFYKTEGQPAQPFLYPSFKQNEETIKEIIADQLKKEIKELVK